MAYYTNPPPAYEEEARQPLFGGDEPDDMYKVGNAPFDIRMQFVRKVYSILTAQILGTIILSSVYMYNSTVQHFVQSNVWLLYISMFGGLGAMLALMWKGRSTPLNYILLGVFTLMESHLVGTVVTFYDQVIVLQALIITFGVFFALTMFTLQSKWDFSGMAPILYAGIWILLIAGIVQIFIPFSEGFQLALAIGGVVIFSGYIILDTYLIFNRYSPEDYIMASVSLYMDIINLFLRILQILNAMQRD
ncbi:inhibitor of apoptosis-promoting Bax1-domain-containing protein [Radiomyces spectabilis]|uniref:inhibitor of apoptosis-promoting Bax1-domain-containing protein n=1 Tax=Radiomyces spectabilis TaxID=64574 RepID=UPI00221E3E8A|nr:inhibitor of apoptosis-promoting Bax1-domain-containing protein [Radiomyces spectabilis]KAI8394031.1 inhibitor of apoptosis-promoting Bax1-domain-containing protein [Radiomyces spectabilis]